MHPPTFVRMGAWSKLLRIWTGLRAGDFRGIKMKKNMRKGRNLRLTIDESKTTRAGKTVVVAFAYVAEGAWLAEER